MLLLVVVFNGVAYMHARAMTHYVRGAEASTERPEDLGIAGRVGALLTGVTVARPRNDVDPGAFGLAAEEVRFESEDGTRLAAWWVPHDRPRAVALVCHGYAAARSSQLSVARELHELGCASLLLDFRGSGESEGDVTTIGWDEALDVAAAARLAAARAPNAPLVLFGTSMGGAAVLRACAVHHVEPAAVAVESVFDRLKTTVGRRFSSMGLPAWPAADALVFWGGASGGFDASLHNPVEYAEAVSCPLLVLHGGDDARVSVSEARSIAAAAGDGMFVVFDGVGHEQLLTARRDGWRLAVRTLLDAL